MGSLHLSVEPGSCISTSENIRNRSDRENHKRSLIYRKIREPRRCLSDKPQIRARSGDWLARASPKKHGQFTSRFGSGQFAPNRNGQAVLLYSISAISRHPKIKFRSSRLSNNYLTLTSHAYTANPKHSCHTPAARASTSNVLVLVEQFILPWICVEPDLLK